MNTTNTRTESIAELLSASVPEVLGTMLTIEAYPVPLEDPRTLGEECVAASVGFVGDVNGIAHLHVTASFARVLAARMLGMPEEEFEGDEMINDVLGEIANMVVGAVKSRLCDDGAPCVLTMPSIVRGGSFTVATTGSSDRRLLAFRCAEGLLLLELLVSSAR